MTALKQPIDWRKLSLINANKIIRDNNIEELQNLLEMVTFADVDGIDDIDPCVATLLKLSQRMTEYTLSTQDQLKQSLLQFQNENVMLKQLNSELEEQNSKHVDYIRKLKVDNRKRRKIIEDLQKRIDLGANAYYSCPYCDKNFINATFLQGHLARKHPDKVAYVGDALAHAQKMVNDVNHNLETEKNQISKQQKVLEEKLKLEEENRIKALEAAKNNVLSAADARNVELIDTINALKNQLLNEKRDNDEKNLIQEEQLNTFKKTIFELQGNLGETNKRLEERPTEIIRSRSPANQSPVRGATSSHASIRERSPQNQPTLTSTASSHSLGPRSPEANVPKVPLSYHSPEQKPKQIETVKLKADVTERFELDSQQPQTEQLIGGGGGPPTLPPSIQRQDFINQLEHRLKDLQLDLSMSGLPMQEYSQKMEILKQNRFNQARHFPTFYNTRQMHTNKLESELSLKSRHLSSHSMGGASSSGYGSPTRLKSLSSQNLPESYSSILKKPASGKPPRLGGSMANLQLQASSSGLGTASGTALPTSSTTLGSLPASHTGLPHSDIKVVNKAKQLEMSAEMEVAVQDRTVTSTPPLSRENSYQEGPSGSDHDHGHDHGVGDSESESPTDDEHGDGDDSHGSGEDTLHSKAEEPTNVTPRNEPARERELRSDSQRQSIPNRVETESESEEESTAWDESTRNSKSLNDTNQSQRSQSLHNNRQPIPKSRNIIQNVSNRNNLDDEDEESSDDWMDELDQALKNQGYNN